MTVTRLAEVVEEVGVQRPEPEEAEEALVAPPEQVGVAEVVILPDQPQVGEAAEAVAQEPLAQRAGRAEVHWGSPVLERPQPRNR